MTPKDLREHALSLPDAREAPHFARTSFRVRGRIFATMTADGTEAMVRVAPQARVRELLRAKSGAFFSHGGWTRRLGAVGVRLARVPATLMRTLVTESWRRASTR